MNNNNKKVKENDICQQDINHKISNIKGSLKDKNSKSTNNKKNNINTKLNHKKNQMII